MEGGAGGEKRSGALACGKQPSDVTRLVFLFLFLVYFYSYLALYLIFWLVEGK